MDVHTGADTAQIFPLNRDLRIAETGGAESPLASLAAVPIAGRFCAWRGETDRRYVASVYAVDRAAGDSGLPDFQSFVLMSVGRGALGRHILAVATIERASDRAGALALGLSLGAVEWHVHFLADDRRARAAVVADLRGRHGVETIAARCA